MAASPIRILRYRFDSPEQVPRHFHASAGRVVLFYPAFVDLRPGEPVMLDVTFGSSEQHCALRGVVLARETSFRYGGAWLEFSAYRLVSSLQAATAKPRRRLRRFPSDQVIHIDRGEGMSVLGRLIDVGAGGARIGGVSYQAQVGDKVRLSVFARDTGAPVIAGRVAWVRGPELGIEFRHPAPNERTAVASLVGDARERLSGACEAQHPAICRCTDGTPLAEPPLPRSTHRATGTW